MKEALKQALEPYFNEKVDGKWFAIDNCKIVILIGEE